MPKPMSAKKFMIPNKDGFTPLHFAARDGNLAQVPAEVLTVANLLTESRIGLTPLSLAACNAALNEIPNSLLTPENMCKQNSLGISALHAAAEYGHIAMVPAAILTVENLLLEDKDGWTPLHWAEDTGTLDVLLGTDFGSRDIADVVGEEWVEANNRVLAQRSGLVAEQEVPDIELF